MTTQEQKRIRRKKRQNHKVRMTKARAKELGITGERPTVKTVSVKNKSHSNPSNKKKSLLEQNPASSTIRTVKKRLRKSTRQMAHSLR